MFRQHSVHHVNGQHDPTHRHNPNANRFLTPLAQPDVGDLHEHRHAVEVNDLVTPVELVGFTRRKAQGT